MGNKSSKIYQEQIEIIQKKLNDPILGIKFKEKEIDGIIRLDALDLQHEIVVTDHVSVDNALRAFHQQNVKLNNRNHALTDVLYDKPLKRAETLQELIDNGKFNLEQFPLTGFILSVKDCFKLKGTTCTYGFSINLGKTEETQSKTMKLLIEKGALITCKGNIPQGLFSMECNNNIFGTATNPYDEKRSPGGSSGGDAALVATYCVNAALGNDNGGSVSIPALFCGIVGFKPTLNRISNEAEAAYFYKQTFNHELPDATEITYATIGPLTRSVKDAEMLMKVLIESSKFDPTVPPLPWRQVKLPKKIGLFMGFSQIEIAPSHRRALNMAADVLRKHNIEVEELNLDHFFEDIAVYSVAQYFKDNILCGILRQKIAIKEPLINEYRQVSMLLKLPIPIVVYLAKKYAGKRRGLYIKALLKSYRTNTQNLKREISDFTLKFRESLSNRGINMLLAPGMVTPAVLHGSADINSLQEVYTFMFNLFNFAAGALPITRVAENEQYYTSTIDDEITQSFVENMKNSAGLPVGVQVAGFSWMDEEVIHVMKAIEKDINYA